VNEAVIWHELECGPYRADLGLWRELARQYGGPVLDVGAGVGRVALALARDGHQVVALDRDAALLVELERRIAAAPPSPGSVETVAADARTFALDRSFALVIVPMQTLQLLGGRDGRLAFFARVHSHLAPGGLIAAAVATELEPFELQDGGPAPLPDVGERDGHVFFSQPTAVRRDGDGFVLERRRDTVGPDGEWRRSHDTIRLDQVTLPALRSEAATEGLLDAGVRTIAATDEHVASEVIMFNG
jgi:SAM-dependent methyltransferase